MTATYTALATYTVPAGGDSEIVFQSIPNTFRDLILVFAGTYTSGDGNIQIQFNSNGDNYFNFYMLGGGSGSGASGTVAQPWIYSGGLPAGVQTNAIWQFMDYSATNKHKTVLNRSNDPSAATYAWIGRWANNDAINRIRIVGQDDYRTFAAGSTFSLYGIA